VIKFRHNLLQSGVCCKLHYSISTFSAFFQCLKLRYSLIIPNSQFVITLDINSTLNNVCSRRSLSRLWISSCRNCAFPLSWPIWLCIVSVALNVTNFVVLFGRQLVRFSPAIALIVNWTFPGHLSPYSTFHFAAILSFLYPPTQQHVPSRSCVASGNEKEGLLKSDRNGTRHR
jgi:hypothetical protein